MKKILYFILCAIILFPAGLLGWQEVTPPLALLIGLIFALTAGCLSLIHISEPTRPY